jgi:hypothetical protein
VQRFCIATPEAFENQAGAGDLFTALLAGLVFFFLLGETEVVAPRMNTAATKQPWPAIRS